MLERKGVKKTKYQAQVIKSEEGIQKSAKTNLFSIYIIFATIFLSFALFFMHLDLSLWHPNVDAKSLGSESIWQVLNIKKIVENGFTQYKCGHVLLIFTNMGHFIMWKFFVFMISKLKVGFAQSPKLVEYNNLVL